jgi:curved DNA-binding protein
MIFKDYYKILGLDSNKVTIEQIKIAYREQAKRYHPDVNVGNEKAEDRFKDVNEAYRVLLDISARRKYDRIWNTYVGKKKEKNFEESKREKGSIFSEFFNMFFGASNEIEKKETVKEKKKAPSKGENIETEIPVEIEEAFYGVEKKVSLRTVDGKLKTFDVKVPAGIRKGEKVRLLGQGKQGINGGKNGDLLIKINIKNNSKFKINGYDLLTDLCITPWEAALGSRASINGIEEKISLYIPAGIQSGEVVKIPQKGYKDGKGGRGNLIVEIKIMVQKELTKEERMLYAQMAEISKFNPRKGYIKQEK